MKKLVLVGGGGHCKSVLDVALNAHEFDEIVITDAELAVGTEVMGCKVVGKDKMLPQLRDEGFEYAFVTVGSIKNTSVRRRLVNALTEMGFEFPVICASTAAVSSFATIGEGTFVGKNVVINAEAEVRPHCIINTGSIVEHECFVGEFTHVAVGAVICGDSHIGSDCLIGAGSTVLQGRSIGNNCIVGAGSVVNLDLQDGCTAVGVPVKTL